MALSAMVFDARFNDMYREATHNRPAMILLHQMRACPSNLSHRRGMKKSIGQFSIGDTLCITCRRRST
jgi:hypothetical protein